MIYNSKLVDFTSKLLNKNSKVLDIGGGKNPFPLSTHIIDVSNFNEKIKNRIIGFDSNNYLKRDFYENPWPYEDNEFDFSICSNVLEDLRDPIHICKEISRVSKSGLILCPTRAFESCQNIVNRSFLEKNNFGFLHHRWFVEIINGELAFKAKNSFLHLNKKFRIHNYKQKYLLYFWKDKIICKEHLNSNYNKSYNDHEEFYNLNKKFNQENNYDLFNFCENKLEIKPDFSSFADFDEKLNLFNKLKIIIFYYFNKILKKKKN